jgi:hypothetical protein
MMKVMVMGVVVEEELEEQRNTLIKKGKL